ncbi:uvrD_C_2 domain-containing protein [Trichonephila clavipes]|nr:uvrD_C_2 domain-containing protein [Trichonephila clavipes]
MEIFQRKKYSVVSARISSQSSRHCWRSPLPHASALIQRDFGCVLGVQQTKLLPHVAKVDLRAKRTGKQFNLVIDEEPLDNACHVWSRIILLKYGCDLVLKTRIPPSGCWRQLRDSSVKTTSFHSAIHILLSSHHWRWRRLWFCVKGRPSNGWLADRPLCCKRRRMGVAFTVASSVESRFITKGKAQSVCPEGIRLIFRNVTVNEYNHSILNSEGNKLISLASVVFVGCHNAEQENFLRQKLHGMRADDTGGLPYQLILVLNRTYMITNNIDAADGLSNGTVEKLCYVERDENHDIRIWMKFRKLCGRKRAIKSRNLSICLNLDGDAVPITPQTTSVSLNNNKTIIAKRKHFPLISALAMTIHKSQGGTYDAIVYEYDRKHPRELVYVALTRVTRIQGLFLFTQENISISQKFWMGRTGTPLNASETDKHHKRSISHREDLTLEL